ncbi:MAG: hypothetical protein FWF94_03235 [Oscillospiraceae bacterium]|nr:hypothetical protein [Oscillospiraceae bacterium]
MTDRQFDSHKRDLLRELKRAEEEIRILSDGKIKSKILEELISDTKDDLKRP